MPVWTDLQVSQWLSLLGRSREKRIAVIKDLLAHANEDGMTPEDRTICRRALRALELPCAISK